MRSVIPRPVLMGLDRILKAGSGWEKILDLPRTTSRTREGQGGVGLVTSDGAPSGLPGAASGRSALLDAGLPITRIFTPEHGLTATAPDGSSLSDGPDPETGLPVISLYGPRFRVGPEELDGLELVLFDLQDVGARFYTFLWTLSHVMEGCAEAGIPIRVLDRPNPLGGLEESVEGPIQDAQAPESFLGRWPIPIRHSLTLGEMALLLRDEMGLDLDLGIVTMEGWRRGMLWPDTWIPFHPPSPGIPAFPSALLYPGTALLEATNLHEGRGSPLAFQWCGAPWLNGTLLAEQLNEAKLPGVLAHAHPLDISSPTNGMSGWPGGGGTPLCPGVRIEVTDPRAHRPVATGLRLLSLLSTLWPGEFSWGTYPTASNPTGEGHLQRLLGSRVVAHAMEADPAGVTEGRIREWTDPGDWWKRAEPHLLYS
jgi:uncharacterized protein YbbC (DUF1343 family)